MFFFFQDLSLICLAIGTVFNVIFYFGTKNCNATDNLSDTSTNSSGENQFTRSLMTWRCWLKQIQFWQVGLLQDYLLV